ncbi:MAG: hypothetical protein EXS35_18800 [Pedosphaera sp.]|nr:hypothetical protein [Pedosphaera sp.]
MKKLRPVIGLSTKNVLSRFTTKNGFPRVDERFAKRWVWWWRNLPDMLARFESKVKAGGGKITNTTPEDLFAASFKSYSQSVTFETFLDGLFERELEHRINGGSDWRHLPGSWTMPVLPNTYAEIRVEISLAANLPAKEAQARFLNAYRDAQSAAGIKRVKLTRSNAFTGAWSRHFNVIETLDRLAWGWSMDSDDAAPVRSLFRAHGLRKGW